MLTFNGNLKVYGALRPCDMRMKIDLQKAFGRWRSA